MINRFFLNSMLIQGKFSFQTMLAGKAVRVLKACDYCRHQKTKCSGTNPCTICENQQIPCAYTKATKKRGPSVGVKDDMDGANIIAKNYDSSAITDIKWIRSDPHLIPIESVVADLGVWTPRSFPAIEVNGEIMQWLDAYFKFVHPRFPILCEPFIRENYIKLPMFLLHAMYAFTLTVSTPIDSAYPSGDYHYLHCKLHFEQSHNYPNPFAVLATFLMATYAIVNTSAVIGGISWVAAAIRNAQTFGIFQLSDIEWRAEDGTVFGHQVGTSKRFSQMLALHLYEIDCYTSFIRNLPPLLTEFLDPELFSPIESDDASNYSPFYESHQWCYFFRLLEIKFRIMDFIRNTPLAMSDTDWIEKLNFLDDSLQDWYILLPSWMKKNTAGFSFDPLSKNPPPFYTGFIISMYHTMRIILHKAQFLSALDLGIHNHPAINICQYSANQITQTYKSFVPMKEAFAQVPLFSFYPVFISGAVHIVSQRINTNNELTASIDASMGILRFLSDAVPKFGHRFVVLQEFSTDPIKATVSFGSMT